MWDSGLKFVKSCGHVEQNFNVYTSQKAMAKINILMKERSKIEWLAFLKGKIHDNRGIVYVDDLYIPENQDNSTASVDDIDCDEAERATIIGVIHSHHSMGCTFSGTDWEYLNSNHDVSIVVANRTGKNEFNVAIRRKTSCGAYTHIMVDNVSIASYIEDDEYDAFIETIDDRISKFPVFRYGRFNGGYFGGQNYNKSWAGKNQHFQARNDGTGGHSYVGGENIPYYQAPQGETGIEETDDNFLFGFGYDDDNFDLDDYELCQDGEGNLNLCGCEFTKEEIEELEKEGIDLEAGDIDGIDTSIDDNIDIENKKDDSAPPASA